MQTLQGIRTVVSVTKTFAVGDLTGKAAEATIISVDVAKGTVIDKVQVYSSARLDTAAFPKAAIGVVNVVGTAVDHDYFFVDATADATSIIGGAANTTGVAVKPVTAAADCSITVSTATAAITTGGAGTLTIVVYGYSVA
tara:strand:- start:22945 stop:23364 length:420 start_codon:yes stop_codon:yes gene_type:complete